MDCIIEFIEVGYFIFMLLFRSSGINMVFFVVIFRIDFFVIVGGLFCGFMFGFKFVGILFLLLKFLL